jgi:hypothetical protein
LVSDAIGHTSKLLRLANTSPELKSDAINACALICVEDAFGLVEVDDEASGNVDVGRSDALEMESVVLATG